MVARAPWPSAAGSVAIPLAAHRADVDGPRLDRAPPRLGEDTDAVLREAGLAPDDIAALRASGALGA